MLTPLNLRSVFIEEHYDKLRGEIVTVTDYVRRSKMYNSELIRELKRTKLKLASTADRINHCKRLEIDKIAKMDELFSNLLAIKHRSFLFFLEHSYIPELTEKEFDVKNELFNTSIDLAQARMDVKTLEEKVILLEEEARELKSKIIDVSSTIRLMKEEIKSLNRELSLYQWEYTLMEKSELGNGIYYHFKRRTAKSKKPIVDNLYLFLAEDGLVTKLTNTGETKIVKSKKVADSYKILINKLGV